MVGEYVYKKAWRRTRFGAITQSIAICLVCGAVIEPTGYRRSRTGSHGEDFYVHEHPLEFIYLYRSNSGRREINFSERLRREYPHLVRELELLWCYKTASPREIEEFVAAALSGELKEKGEKRDPLGQDLAHGIFSEV